MTDGIGSPCGEAATVMRIVADTNHAMPIGSRVDRRRVHGRRTAIVEAGFAWMTESNSKPCRLS
jgi:hypothetical protein